MTTYENEGFDPKAVTEQPGAEKGRELRRISAQPAPQGCPPGLEYLTMVDQLLINQSVELLEAFTGLDIENRFQIKNSMGQPVYMAAEVAGFCTRQCCGSRRGFKMHVADPSGKEVLKVKRSFKCCAGCCWCACLSCCSYEVKVEAPVGTVIGYVRQSCSLWKPRFEVLDENREAILTISGPMCILNGPCCEPRFNVRTLEGEKVGKITKRWSGLVKEAFTLADNFGISFPLDLDVKIKGTLIGAVFLINMMYFEKKKKSMAGD